MIKAGQRYQWSDKAGIIEALSDGSSGAKFKVVQAWPGIAVGYQGFWYITETYSGCRLILLEGQDAPKE